jgi:AcrR family transcriptional regulator
VALLQRARSRTFEGPAGPLEREPVPPRPKPDPFTDPIQIAVVDLIFERGYEAFDERAIVRRAGATMAEFRSRFVDKQDCTVRTIEACLQDFKWMVETAYDTGADWREGLRASAWAVADHLDEHPELVHVLVIGLLGAKNEMLRVLREEALMYGATVIERGRAEAPEPAAVPAGAAAMAMGSIAQLLTHRLQKGVDVAPHATVRQMLYLSARPYVGEEAAAEELRLPRPPGSWVRRSAPLA